ncbi:MAG: SAM-dependent methyltransferase [Proteobacteria bacterium]|nr:SAM-dependent methyltransferase [Pseudomonadota bacterium]
MAPGTQGYSEQAAELIPRYEAESFEHKHRAELHVLPKSPGSVLDVGSGTGGDAAWLARQGHSVLAVEPTCRLREAAIALHPDPGIEWLDDSLPLLRSVRSREVKFDAIMLTAVWMHLEASERILGMKSLASLLGSDGVLIMSLRHGAVPQGRRMFEVSSEETVALAESHGLMCVLNVHTESSQAVNRIAGVSVTWTRLAFRWQEWTTLRSR